MIRLYKCQTKHNTSNNKHTIKFLVRNMNCAITIFQIHKGCLSIHLVFCGQVVMSSCYDCGPGLSSPQLLGRSIKGCDMGGTSDPFLMFLYISLCSK